MAEKVIWLEVFWLEVHPYPHPSPEPQGSNMPVVDIAAQNFTYIFNPSKPKQILGGLK